ncbi:MAG: hypothetical protein ACOCRA_04245 [Halobacteria archaeon]
MRRREFVTAAAAGAAGVTGCIEDGGGNETDGNETDQNDTDDGSDTNTTVTGTSFSTSDVRGGDVDESASYSFDDRTLTVTGVIEGSDACKTAELEDARYDAGEGAIVVDVVTTEPEEPFGGTCAQVITPIRYEATVEFEGGRPAVVVTHDGEEVDASEDTGDENGGEDEDRPTLTDSEFEVTGSECGEEVDEAEYSRTQATSEGDESTGVVEGKLSGPDSCTTAELGYLSYDAEDDTLVADIRSASTDEDACADCITEVDYRLEATFENGVAESASVSHDGVRVDAVGDGIADAEFSVVERTNASGDEGSGDADFDEEEGEITLTGTVIGNNGCATARLAEAGVEDGALNIDIETVSDGGDVCTQALVAVRYEATFTFEDEAPDEVSVSHDGEGVMSGAYESESVSAEPDNETGN